MTAYVPFFVGFVAAAAQPGAEAIHTVADVGAWMPNADGGHAPSVAATKIGEEPAVLFAYVQKLPGWGNSGHRVRVPPIFPRDGNPACRGTR